MGVDYNKNTLKSFTANYYNDNEVLIITPVQNNFITWLLLGIQCPVSIYLGI